MNSLISTFSSTIRLFRQPKKIGETLEHNEKSFLILGIEKFKIYGNELKVWYTCQDLSQTEYISLKKAYPEPHGVELYVQFRHDDHEKIMRMSLGSTWTVKGTVYKVTEYTEIKLIGTDIYIAMAARPIYPIDRKEAKAKLFSDRRKKLNLELV